MGFGSYDESEQEKHDFDADEAAEDSGVDAHQNPHDGEVEYDPGASNDELLDKLEDIKGEDVENE